MPVVGRIGETLQWSLSCSLFTAEISSWQIRPNTRINEIYLYDERSA